MIRLCIYQYQHHNPSSADGTMGPRREAGFDILWNVDAVHEPDRPGMTMFEASTTLAAMALSTSRIRVGTLVTSMYLRNPVMMAKAAMTLDHLSGRRLEIAVGAGDPSVRPEAAGVEPWTEASRWLVSGSSWS